MFWRRKRTPIREELPENIVRRVKSIQAGDLLDWAEATLHHVDNDIKGLRRGVPNSDAHYGEALQSAYALTAVLQELQYRTHLAPFLETTPPVLPPRQIPNG
jgi:hypothetical protein